MTHPAPPVPAKQVPLCSQAGSKGCRRPAHQDPQLDGHLVEIGFQGMCDAHIRAQRTRLALRQRNQGNAPRGWQ